MSKVFNMVGGGGGKNISSIIITGLSSTYTVTCTKYGKSYSATWDETEKHWEIVGLPLGTFIITATNGPATVTETVLIDIVGIYEIEMTSKLYLYNYGNECEDVTGGWVKQTSGGTVTKNDDNVTLSSRPLGDGTCILQTKNTIDTTGYTKLCAELSFSCSYSSQDGVVSVSKSGSYDLTNNDAYIRKNSNTGRGIFEASLTSHHSDYYGHIKTYGGDGTATTLTVYSVWLE